MIEKWKEAEEKPLVSIITPTFNAVKYLQVCIESVLGQTYPYIEHVIVDGHSGDGTVQVLERYQAQYRGRIRFISEGDSGPGEAWNKGLRMAEGSIFGCLGYDDVYTLDAVETVVDFFLSHQEACFVHGDCDFISPDGEVIRRHRAREYCFEDFVNTSRQIATPSAFYRRIVMERIGWLDSCGDDFDVMLRIAKRFPVHSVDRVLSKTMIHTESVFCPTSLEKRAKLYRDRYIISRRYGGRILTPIALRYYAAMSMYRLRLEPFFPLALNFLRFVRKIAGKGEQIRET
jgi:glycosyltransferase involved in cell wall biosynthesis